MNENVGVNKKPVTAQEMKFSIKGFVNKCDQSAGNCGFGYIY